MTDCIFCKIVAGEIPSYKIYEDENYLAFLDISQINDGHTIVIPKQHYRWVWEVEDVQGYMKVTEEIARHFQELTGGKMVMGAVWGEQVPHAHIHLVPETEGNLPKVAEAWNEALGMRKKTPEEMTKITERFKL